MDPNIKQSIIDRLKQTNNVLVTVKSNPTVDQLAACIGLTLFLNKQGKHATAVFSGEVPSTIEFLKPEDTLEKDTNSLRDFIIALDKSKADKLRYKVEDKVVKIFITPYRTSLSQNDLDFSQGDFNVDVVIALGVHAREELDQAIMAHGRILHDATVVSINSGKPADLGALNWSDDKASSLSEMVAGLVDTMQSGAMDAQMATAFLTGIVAVTDRFSNTKTTSVTMSLSAKLMAAGANQQLVASKLQEGDANQAPSAAAQPDAGTLEIGHTKDDNKVDVALPEPQDEVEPIHIDEGGRLKGSNDDSHPKIAEPDKPKQNHLAMDPPTMGGTLTASAKSVDSQQMYNPLSDNPIGEVDSAKKEPVGTNKEIKAPSQAQHKGVDLAPAPTLSAIEQDVDSPHLAKAVEDEKKLEEILQSGSSVDTQKPVPNPAVAATGIDDARKAVEAAALTSAPGGTDPVQSLNAKPLGQDLNPVQPSSPPLPGNAPNPADTPLPTPSPTASPTDSLGLPPNLVPPNQSMPSEQTGTDKPPTPPPPVPPPMMPPTI